MFIILSVLVAVMWIIFWYNKTHQKNKHYLPPSPISKGKTESSQDVPQDILVEQNNINGQKWIKEQIKYLDDLDALTSLLNKKTIPEIRYFDLLNCFEWKFKRLMILVRDNFKCQHCHEISEFNHVHHTYYLKGKLPWDITSAALLTLCPRCHHDVHQNSNIRVCIEENGQLKSAPHNSFYCNRCNNTGYLPQFNHVENGICFKCRGECFDTSIFSSALKPVSADFASYKAWKKREEYREFLNNVDPRPFVDLLKKPPSTSNNVTMDAGDDLPF